MVYPPSLSRICGTAGESVGGWRLAALSVTRLALRLKRWALRVTRYALSVKL